MENVFQDAGTALAALISRIEDVDGDDLEHVEAINRALFRGQHCAAQLELLAGDDDGSDNVIHLHTDNEE